MYKNILLITSLCIITSLRSSNNIPSLHDTENHSQSAPINLAPKKERISNFLQDFGLSEEKSNEIISKDEFVNPLEALLNEVIQQAQLFHETGRLPIDFEKEQRQITLNEEKELISNLDSEESLKEKYEKNIEEIKRNNPRKGIIEKIKTETAQYKERISKLEKDKAEIAEIIENKRAETDKIIRKAKAEKFQIYTSNMSGLNKKTQKKIKEIAQDEALKFKTPSNDDEEKKWLLFFVMRYL